MKGDAAARGVSEWTSPPMLTCRKERGVPSISQLQKQAGMRTLRQAAGPARVLFRGTRWAAGSGAKWKRQVFGKRRCLQLDLWTWEDRAARPPLPCPCGGARHQCDGVAA